MESSSIFFTVVVAGDSLAPEAMKILSGKCRVQFAVPYPKPPELAQKLKQEKADALIVRTGKISAEVIKASLELKVISKHGIGVDTVDVQTATELKILVLVASSANYQSVAEHALGLMLCPAKDIARLDSRIR
jgi:D-3-phosphoglycerate dehydrogenase